MGLNIDHDVDIFRKKLRRLREKGLERYFSSDTMIVPQPNGKSIQIPIPEIEFPRFIFGQKQTGGVGQGDGEVGDSIADGDQQGNGKGHGDGAGKHSFGDVSLEAAAELLGSYLELPNLLDKFAGNLGSHSASRYKSIRPVGPKSLRNFKRTYQRALQRSIASGSYDPLNPIIIPRHEDERFRAPVEDVKPNTKAAVIYLLDSSGSMSNVINFVQNVGWWADAWIQKHYQDIERRYVQYDSFAREVLANEFYSITAGGGTSMINGLQKAKRIAQKDFPENQYNLYLVHFTDGDCYGIEVSKEDLEYYKKLAQDYPDEIDSINDLELGNPLTDFFIPRSSAIFVCEAGAYHHRYSNNYSNILENLVTANPALEKKLRFVTYGEKDIAKHRSALIKETLKHWFK